MNDSFLCGYWNLYYPAPFNWEGKGLGKCWRDAPTSSNCQQLRAKATPYVRNALNNSSSAPKSGFRTSPVFLENAIGQESPKLPLTYWQDGVVHGVKFAE